MYLIKISSLSFTAQLELSTAVQFFVGDCPIYFQEPCNSTMVKFILSSRIGGRTTLHALDPYKPRLPRGYNVLVPLKIAIHGYGGLTVDVAIGNVTKAYQELGYNVIIGLTLKNFNNKNLNYILLAWNASIRVYFSFSVDWEPLASLPCYTTAYLNTWHVGQCISILAVSLLSLGISPGFVHVVGFSLGAHVAGLAGSNLKNALGHSFKRITGEHAAVFANNEIKSQ